METETKENTGASTTVGASNSGKKAIKKIRYKEITLKAAREFTVLPKGVQSETRTRVGAFAVEGETIAYRSLSEKEIKQFGLGLIGVSANAPNFEEKVNTYFNDFAINLIFEQEEKIVVPINEEGDIILSSETKGSLFNIMKYRHCMKHPKVARSFTQYEEAPQFYIAYIVDTNLLKVARIKSKNIRRTADKMYLELTMEKNSTKLDWVLELARRGTFTNNIQDPPEGYIPSSLRGVLDIAELDEDERELAVEEFKNDRPEEFVALNEDKDLEWKALLERMVVLGVLARKGNVIMNQSEALGGDDDEAIAKMKSPSFSKTLTTIKARLQNKEKSKKE